MCVKVSEYYAMNYSKHDVILAMNEVKGFQPLQSLDGNGKVFMQSLSQV